MKYKAVVASPELAPSLIREADALRAERSSIDALNQEIADYIMPRKNQINKTNTQGTDSPEEELYDLTAVRDSQILAAGQLDYLVSGRWFQYDPPAVLSAGARPDDEAQQYCQRCTEIVLRELANSNFNTELHEMLLDRSTFTHASLFVEELSDDAEGVVFNFRKDDVGTYSIAENNRGRVDKVFRDFEFTARQAIQEFGAENCSKAILSAMEDKSQCDIKKFQFIHACYPRPLEQQNPKKLDPKFFPIASVYVDCADKRVVRESGFPEMPYIATRFLKWGKSPYGYSPAIEALPAVRQVNLMTKHMAALGEIAAWPRILVPHGLTSRLDLSPGGETVVDPNVPADAWPREFGTGGRWDIGEALIKQVQEQIHKTFFVDLFQMLANLERGQMTAYEVSARLAEKVRTFSPTFERLSQEVFRPLLTRCFSIAFRRKMLPEAPRSMLVIQNGSDMAALAMPQIILTGKMALRIKEVENTAFLQAMEIIAPMAQYAPEVLHNIDYDEGARAILRNYGVAANVVRSVQDRDEMRAEIQAAQAQAAQMEQAAMAAKAVRDVGAAPEDMREQIGSAVSGEIEKL